MSDFEDQEQLDEEPRSVILDMIKQLSYGMDLSKVTFPTFVLEPRSMLERITDFMAHPELIIQAASEKDKMARFIGILRFFLAGWHIRPKGVKKPYNPVLGEIFRCQWKFADGSNGFYIAEQVSHHPPISAFFYSCPQHHITINGHLAPKSRFLGNSVASKLEGSSFRVRLTNLEEEFFITLPNLYARGILIGTMVYEVSDPCKVSCDKHDIVADIEFKSKGYFTGTYNALVGTVKNDGDTTHKISGKWSDQMFIQSTKGKKNEVLFDATDAEVFKKIVLPESEQTKFESRRLWSEVTKAIRKGDQNQATEQKTLIEEEQRRFRTVREEKGVSWSPRHFRKVEGSEEWVSLYSKDKFEPSEYVQFLQEKIFDKFDPQLEDLS